MKAKHEFTNEELKEHFRYAGGSLYWKKGKFIGREVGWLKSQPSPYIICQFKKRLCYVHRLIFQLKKGYLPKVVDHKNRNSLDNRIVNLRESCPSKNVWNQKVSSKNKSGVTGVHFCKKTKKWVASIQSFKVRQKLGYFESKKEAIAIRLKAEKQRGTHCI